MSPEAAATLDHSSTPEGVPTLDQLTTSDQQPTELSYGRARAPGNHGPPRIRMNIVLFVLTFTSSIYWGFIQYQQFYSEELRSVLTSNPFEAPSALLGGLPFGIAVIAILLAPIFYHYHRLTWSRPCCLARWVLSSGYGGRLQVGGPCSTLQSLDRLPAGSLPYQSLRTVSRNRVL